MSTGSETLYVRAKLTTTPAVDTPSATWLLLAKMSANASPLPSLTPTDLHNARVLVMAHVHKSHHKAQTASHASGIAPGPDHQLDCALPVPREGPIACEHDVA